MHRQLVLSVTAGLLLWVAPVHADLKLPSPTENEFHFVVLGDAQFDDPAKFNRIVDQSRALGPAFVIQVGDLIEGYQNDLDSVKNEWQRFKQQVAPLDQIPFLPLPGNHDVYNADRQIDPKLEALYENTWGPLYYSFEYKNALFIALNSDASNSANEIAGKQLKWLQRTLATSSAAHKFVFMHRPPALLENAETLHDMFKAHGVAHVFYGHHHHYHFVERDGIAYTMTNAAANSAFENDAIGTFHHLLQVSVRGDQVDVAVIKLDGIVKQDSVYPADNYDFFALSQKLARKTVEMVTLSEREYTFSITLNNTTSREIRILASCNSADQRWHITPMVIEPVVLVAGQTNTLKLTARFDKDRVPESSPVCTLQVPFQTHHGRWIEYHQTVAGLRIH